MKKLSLKQGTQNWLKYKKERVGSSEIFGLIRHYISDQELQNAGINSDEFTEEPYVTAFQLYHKFKNPAIYVEADFDEDLGHFGRRIEEFLFYYLRQKMKYNSTYQRGAVYGDNFKIASLDIEGVTNSTKIIQDSNGFNICLQDNPKFIVEAKGASTFKSRKNDITVNGIDWRFIFQLQYQLMCTDVKWGKIIVVNLKEDNDFKRGFICGLNKRNAIKYIKDNSDILEFVYKERREYQFLIKQALEKFQFDLKTNQELKLPPYDKVFKKNHKLFYNLVHQRGETLGTSTQAIETDEFDFYFDIKKQEEDFEEKCFKVHQAVRELMFDTGKRCIEGQRGKIVLQSNCVRGYKHKEEKRESK